MLVTESVLLLAVAIETLLFAGLVLLISKVGSGSNPGAQLLRLNDVFLGPFAFISFFGGGLLTAVGRQLAAMVGYGAFWAALLGGVAWFERQNEDWLAAPTE